MSFFQRVRIRHLAKQDAAAGRYQGEDRVVALTGPRPRLNVQDYCDEGASEWVNSVRDMRAKRRREAKS